MLRRSSGFEQVLKTDWPNDLNVFIDRLTDFGGINDRDDPQEVPMRSLGEVGEVW